MTEIKSAYIVYDFDAWPNNPLNNSKLKNFLFGGTNIIKNSDKEKWEYSGYGVAFDGSGSWNFDNDYAKNLASFDFGNSSSSHIDNRKNNF